MKRAMTIGAMVCGLLACAGYAQDAKDEGKKETKAMAEKAGQPVFRSSGNPQRDTLLRFQRNVSIELNETRLEDVMKFVQEQTGAELEIFWKGDSGDGLDKELLMTLSIKGLPALEMLDKVLEKAVDGTNENSWQMTPQGVMQIGPKSRLNKYKRVEVYDINDLLFVLPMFDNAPQVDLDKALQSSKGGSGGGSPFKNEQSQQKNNQPGVNPKAGRDKEITDVIVSLVDSQQWADNGGEGGTITYKEAFSGQLIVNAADYMHRQLNGYRWWPTTRATTSGGGKRYVSMNVDTSNSTLNRPLRTQEVTGVAGGR